MWISVIVIAILIAAAAAGIPLLRKRSVVIHPEPDFASQPGAFRRLVAESQALDPGSARLALAGGHVAEWAPTALKVGPPATSNSDATSTPSSDWRDAVWISAPQAGLLAASLADTVHSEMLLDDSMLAALSQLSRTQVEGLADLRSLMDWKGYQLDSVKIQGTVAEQVSGGDFAAAGHTVSFPEASNNPGWDFTIDGHEVNSKLTVDYNNVADAHFSEYPDIPMVINADAAHIPADAIHFDGTQLDPSVLVGDHIVIVDDSLTLSGIDDIAADTGVATDGLDLDDGGTIPGLSLVIAAVRSGYREGRLLNDGKTNWGRAAKNVAVDTGAKGGGALAGGLAGAKVGAVIDVATGGATLGLATVAGGLIGAITGSLVGGKVAQAVKYQPLYDAQETLQDSLLKLDAGIQAAQKQANKQLDAAIAKEQGRLETAAMDAQHRFDEVVQEGRREITRVTVLSPQETRTLLDAATDLVDAAVVAYLADFERRSWIDRAVNRDAPTRVAAEADGWKMAAARLGDVTEGSAGNTEAVFDLIAPLRGGSDAALAFLGRIGEVRQLVRNAARRANEQLVEAIVKMRAASVAALHERADQITASAQAEIQPQLQKVEKAHLKVLQELEMAGL